MNVIVAVKFGSTSLGKEKKKKRNAWSRLHPTGELTILPIPPSPLGERERSTWAIEIMEGNRWQETGVRLYVCFTGFEDGCPMLFCICLMLKITREYPHHHIHVVIVYSFLDLNQ